VTYEEESVAVTKGCPAAMRTLATNSVTTFFHSETVASFLCYQVGAVVGLSHFNSC